MALEFDEGEKHEVIVELGNLQQQVDLPLGNGSLPVGVTAHGTRRIDLIQLEGLGFVEIDDLCFGDSVNDYINKDEGVFLSATLTAQAGDRFLIHFNEAVIAGFVKSVHQSSSSSKATERAVLVYRAFHRVS